MDIQTLKAIREEIKLDILTKSYYDTDFGKGYIQGMEQASFMINGMIKKERNKLKINNK